MKNTLILAALAYLISSFVHFPVPPGGTQTGPHLTLGRLVFAPPRVLSGDSPHYLAAVNSLIEDGDFDLSNNYAQALEGGLDLGVRFRGVPIDHHTETDGQGVERSTHSPFFPLWLSVMVWPLRGSLWVEAACILLTMAASLAALKLFSNLPSLPNARAAVFLLAFATPLWCYSRDLWSAPWILLIWLGLLSTGHPLLLALLSFLGTTIKYPFFVVPASLAVLAFYRGLYGRAAALLGGAGIGILAVIGLVQYLFRDVDHFSWFHSGIHAGFGLPFDGIIGLLFHPRGGIVVFFPFLLWGLSQFRRVDELLLPAMVFFLVHASYDDWMGGTGFSSRYLVPMLPIMVLAVCRNRTGSRLYLSAVAWSICWSVAGGFFPATVYERSPWGVFQEFLSAAMRGLAR